MYGDEIIKCYNCKTDLTLPEYNRAWTEADGDTSQLKWALCNQCEDKRADHHTYVHGFDED
jgi:hypothetical protein